MIVFFGHSRENLKSQLHSLFINIYYWIFMISLFTYFDFPRQRSRIHEHPTQF